MEPVYAIIDTDTGRDIATNLEKDEALKIERVFELSETLYNCRDMLEELFINTRCKDDDFLKSVNDMIIKINVIKKDMEQL